MRVNNSLFDVLMGTAVSGGQVRQCHRHVVAPIGVFDERVQRVWSVARGKGDNVL